jgi:tRNA (uracil-5-)-methyltransferase TRM9
LDVGCGNGKYERYLSAKPNTFVIACDVCEELLDITKTHTTPHQDCLLANGLNLPYRSDTFDFAISIAVLHHLSSPSSRIAFIEEIIRCTRPGARILITVWAAEQTISPKWRPLRNNDYLIPWTDRYTQQTHYRYYHLFSRQEIDTLMSDLPAKVISIKYERDNWCMELVK